MTLFDDLVQGISKEVSKVQARSQEMLQSYNLQGQIKELERKRTAKLLEIGRLICDKYNRQADISDETLKGLATEITVIDHEIGQVQAEIDKLKLQSDPSKPASQKAEAKAGFTPTPGYECPRCHAPASREKSFCPVCGEPLKKGPNGNEPIDVEPGENN